MPLTMDQLRVRPMDVLMGRTRYDKMRYAAIGFGGAFIALLVIVLAMAGAMAFAARAAGAEFQWGFFIPNKVTWCQGLTPTPEPTIAASLSSYRLPSPTGEGVGAALYMSSKRGREAVGRPGLPDVGHPAGPPQWLVDGLDVLGLVGAVIGAYVFLCLLAWAIRLPSKIRGR